MNSSGVLGVHEDGVARSAREGIDFVVNKSVELLAAPGTQFENAGWARQVRQRDGAEMGLAVHGRKLPVRAKVRPAILNGVPGPFEILHAIVKRDRSGNFLTHGPAGFAA